MFVQKSQYKKFRTGFIYLLFKSPQFSLKKQIVSVFIAFCAENQMCNARIRQKTEKKK